MTINEAITKVDALKPNEYSTTDKKLWLSELDGRIKSEIVDTCEGADDVFFSPYNANTDAGQDLIVTAPYDRLYTDWLCAQIDLNNGEFARYNNDVTVFNDTLDMFKAHYIRTHKPITTASFNY